MTIVGLLDSPTVDDTHPFVRALRESQSTQVRLCWEVLYLRRRLGEYVDREADEAERAALAQREAEHDVGHPPDMLFATEHAAKGLGDNGYPLSTVSAPVAT